MTPDGASFYLGTLYEGTLGATRHGATDRFDWGLTQQTLGAALERHRRLQAIADGLTAEQRDALWLDTSEQAATLRRFVR